MQFSSSRVFEKTTSDLYKIVQQNREPLRDYLTRFNREKVTITNCDVPMAIEAFKRGLERESPSYEELTKYPCRMMDDVQAKAMAQVRLEEGRMEDDEKYYKPSRKITIPRSREYKPYTRPVRDEVYVNSTRESNEWKMEERSDWRKDPNLPPTYDSYGFTITPSTMMKKFTKLGGIVKWPVKSNKPKANPDSKLWCDYHGDYIYKAYNCVALRKELQLLTKKGYLTEFMTSKKAAYVRKDVSPRRDNVTPMRQPPPPSHHKVINFIAGGSEIWGSTYSQAKRVSIDTNILVTQVGVGNDSLPSLMFDESDKRNIRESQQYGLVISLYVGNCLIKRILVDNGSASNIMMLSTLTQMGLAESDMIKKSTTLVGFSGEIKRTLGEITLPTYAQGVNLLENFIIDVDST
ncbi:uncharacterized protein LOC141665785 [Apium graveolens]|uniref:uncharacterized protein LOC141665785 n=1 Tax=Apium graveolens TaxID=4045 RepID=UPI003D78B416